MTDTLDSLLQTISSTTDLDREIALLDLVIYLLSEKQTLPNPDNTLLFLELSHWRDYSLRDDVFSYYESKNAEELEKIANSFASYSQNPFVQKFLEGLACFQKDQDCFYLDTWIFDQKEELNNFLASLALERA